ncbi:MAG: hypothetical protein MUE54_10105, partial [Anaerolineae bacterium]|nr:hypothetical protein [Anaerolineae bacterium]
MKFAVRLTILVIFALAISFGLVSAQDATEVSGSFIQAASTYTMTVNEDETITLELGGVASATPLIITSADASGIFPTADLTADWLASGLSAPATIRFQVGAPVGATEEGAYVDYTVMAELVPVGEYADGVVSYTVTVVDVMGVSLFGDGPAAVESAELDKAADALLENFVDGVLEGEVISVFV